MNAASTRPQAAADPLTLASVLTVLRRRRALILWPATALLLAGALSCLLATRRYQATAEIQVHKEDGGAFGLENGISNEEASASEDPLDYNMTLQTQAQILRSPALALAVIQTAHLESTPDYFPPSVTPSLLKRWESELFFWREPMEPTSIPLAQAPNRRYAAERIFAGRLKIQTIPGTRLIKISYQDRDPRRAAYVANTIVTVLANMAFEQRFTATLQGSTWLSGQLEQLRTQAEQAQARAATLERGTGVYGNDASRNIVLERLDSLNQTLTAAESNRILKESIDKVAAGGSPELISSLSGNSSSGSVASVNTSLSLIQGLRQQEAQVRSELAEDSIRYGPNYPKIAELKAQLAGISGSVAAETKRLGERAHTDWLIAVGEENAARAAFEKQKQLAGRQNDSVIAYELARQEAVGSRNLYENLLAKLKQTSLLAGLRANNVSVVSRAEVPPPSHPSSPNVLLRLGAAAVAGLLLGLGAALWRELTDDTVHSLAQIEATTGAPLLAILPSTVKQKRLKLPGSSRPETAAFRPRLLSPEETASAPFIDHRLSLFSEGIRSLRTSLQLLSSGGGSRVILLTSCLPTEGKTTIAVNLAALFAQSGARVLLVDADLRRPSLHGYSSNPATEGLAMALSGAGAISPQRPMPSLPTLEMLAGSEVPPHPSELLGAPRMKELVAEWKTRYDYIFLDSPPVLPVADAALLSRHCDVTLLIARHRQTTTQALRRGVDVLQRQSAPSCRIGVVLNDVLQSSSEFYDYFGYEGGNVAVQPA